MLGIDFVLETSSDVFSKWLITEIPLPTYGYVLSGLDFPREILYVGDESFLPPSSEWPHLSFIAEGFIFKPKNLEEDRKIRIKEEKGFPFDKLYLSAEGIEREDLGAVIRIDIKEVGENKIHVSAQYNEEFPHLRNCLNELHEQIFNVFLTQSAIEKRTFKAEIDKLLPKRPATKEKYRRAWKVMKPMFEEYANDVLDGRTEKSEPTRVDFRDRLLDSGISYSTKIIGKIKTLGEYGALD